MASAFFSSSHILKVLLDPRKHGWRGLHLLWRCSSNLHRCELHCLSDSFENIATTANDPEIRLTKVADISPHCNNPTNKVNHIWTFVLDYKSEILDAPVTIIVSKSKNGRTPESVFSPSRCQAFNANADNMF